MASFAKATKWLLAGDKVRRKCWPHGEYWRFRANGAALVSDLAPPTLTREVMAATDWVRLVPRKHPVVDESLYEPVGTMPQVGDVLWAINQTARKFEGHENERVTVIDAPSVRLHGDVCAQTKNGRHIPMAEFANQAAMFRILKRRNVFTDPRVGDVIRSSWGDDVIVLTVRAVVPDVGILATISNGAMFGYSFPEWAAKLSHYTVKHRAPEGGAK